MKIIYNKVIKVPSILIIIIYTIFVTNTAHCVKRINYKETIVFAGDYNYPPYEYIDVDGEFKGFNVDIMKAIIKVMDLNAEIIPMKWKDATDALQNGEIDGLIGLTRNSERSQKFLFTNPTIINDQFIFVREGTVHINNLEDLSGLRVAYQENDYNQDIIKQVPSIIEFPMIGQLDSLMALRGGKVDAVLANKLVGIYHLQKQGMTKDIKLAGESLGEAEYGPAVLKENNNLLNVLNIGLYEIRKDKTYDKIYKKWFGDSVSYRRMIFSIYRKEFIFGIILIVLFLFSIYIYNKKLQNEVIKRTKELKNANSDLLKQQKKIYNLAYYDTITSLPNRLYFVEEIRKLYKGINNNNFAMLFLDIDRFKHINDTLGHNVGDYILKLIGIRLSKLLKEEDIVSRVGGDEYFILLNNIKDCEEAIKISEKIIEDFKNPYYVQEYELYLTTSIGISLYLEEDIDSNSLVKNADLALYKAKELGGNSYYVYGEEIESTGLERMMLLNQLRQSLERDELVLYYQPQIDIEIEEIMGLEALIRWNHPDKGLLFPDSFIYLAEESGIIIQIGEWVLKQACFQAKEWIDMGREIMISVNVSAKQFQHRGFLKSIENTLKETELKPTNLILEITETIAISDMEYTLSILEKLNKLNIAVAIDDFGTGYSSLNYLNQMNVNELKIDRSFIWDIEKNEKNKMIANTIIVLAKQLGLKVTAEGVENLEQLEILKQMKCDVAQGYYFSKPVPKEQIDNMIKGKP